MPRLELSTIVCKRVAEAEDVSPLELPPLHAAIDPTVIESLPEGATLTFSYHGHTVVVYGEGTVTVRDSSDEGRGSMPENPTQ